MRSPSPLTLAFCLIILYELEENVITSPIVRMLENAICQQYYSSGAVGDGNVPEASCKINAVQKKLAYITGYYSLFKNIPGILLGSYFSRLADTLGRRPVYALNVIGMTCEVLFTYIICHFWRVFPIEIVWLSSLFYAIGGGIFILLALHMTIVSDLTTEADRDRNIYKAFALKYTADLIGPQIASIALAHRLWLPSLISGVLLTLSLPVLFLLPETHPGAKPNLAFAPSRSNSHHDPRRHGSFRRLLRDERVWICLLLTFLTQYRYIQVDVLIPYTSVRFHWEISQVSRLLSITPGISLIICSLLPTLVRVVQERLSLDVSQVNVLVVRSMLSTLMLGTGLIAAAPTVGYLIAGFSVFSVGHGIRASVLAVASESKRSSADTSSLFTLLSLTDGFSHMMGAPFLQSIWAQGLEFGGAWLVLPFFVTLLLFAGAVILSFALRASTHVDELEEDESHQRLLAE